MADEWFIDPDRVRRSGFLSLKPIPINRYGEDKTDLNFSKKERIQIYSDMLLIRQFEQMIESLRSKGEYQGIRYRYSGSAHLSVGQEATAVGMAFELETTDYLFGSHRSHGEILAKGLSVLHKQSEKKIEVFLRSFEEGRVISFLENTGLKWNDHELNVAFLVVGLLGEILGKKIGFNRGIIGSMHAFFTPWGIYPNNAIVGASVPLALGAALHKKIHLEKGLVIASVGDASLACGPVWESLMFSAMDQFKLLWNDPYRGGLPLIVNIVDNQYGMGSRTCGETAGYQIPARVAASINPEQLHVERVDGYDPLAVIDAYRRKKDLIREGKGPVMLDLLTYRLSAHSNEDTSVYRSLSEVSAWQERDPLETYRNSLIKEFNCEQELDELALSISQLLKKCLKSVLFSDSKLDWTKDGLSKYISQSMFPQGLDDFKTMTLSESNNQPLYLNNSRIIALHKLRLENRSGFSRLSISDVLYETILQRALVDKELIIYGEECRDWGGAFGVYRGLKESLPYQRLFNTSISEAAIVGSAIGYAMTGGKVLIEIMYADFMTRAADELMNQLPKWVGMSGAKLKLPIVIRVSIGRRGGPQHAQDWSGLLSSIPGLKIVYPVTPFDAKGLLNSALNSLSPVLFFESQELYDQREIFFNQEIPEKLYCIPLGEPVCRKEGKDLTIITVGPVLYRALEAIDELENRGNLSVELIDVRSLVPLNYEILCQSVSKTGKVLILGDMVERSSFLKEIAANLSQLVFDKLEKAPVVLGAKDWIVPVGAYADFCFPDKERILDVINASLIPLSWHCE